jgi:cobalt/nickel transport system permease protein
MHIPDALLSPSVAAATSLIGAGGLSVCSWKLRHELRERTTVLMGTMSAFVFAAQMVKFPLFPLPISGHLLGGVLVAVLLGPWAGALVIATVLIVQCLLFGDGGVTALGANFLNMGVIGAIGGYAIYAPIRRVFSGPSGVLIGGMVAAWFSVILASGAFATELSASIGWSGFFNVLGWMALVHAGIGMGEALITGAVLRFLLLKRPDLFENSRSAESSLKSRWGQVLVGGLAIAVAVAVFLAPFASEHADGLEWVGGKLGFLKEETAVFAAPIPDYQLPLPGIRHVKVATAIAGLVGTLVVAVVGCVLARLLTRQSPVTVDTERLTPMNRRGFMLIELLVVIAIIAIYIFATGDGVTSNFTPPAGDLSGANGAFIMCLPQSMALFQFYADRLLRIQ